ncbi:MAG: asparagine--tRNA ligase, partial [Acidobacteria bacterium]|nr:asparagine--tRNA ligase [Acidobacteriota bacterium]
MSEFTIAQAARFQGQQVTLRGWLYNLRESGKLLFPQFRDGTGIMQAVVSKADVSPEVWERATTLTQESSVIAHGTVRADKRAPGGYELVLNDLTVVQRVPTDQPYPISPKEHGVDFLMSQRHLWMRSAKQSALLRLRHEVIAAIRDFFDSNGFILTDAPILTPAACEGTTTLFELDYFDLGPAYLTQSGQLYIEATAAALGKVYCFGPTFRAEKSKTRRHLTEFWMVEPELSFATLDDLMKLGEDLVTHIVARVLERRRPELETLERDTSKLENVRPPFHRL